MKRDIMYMLTPLPCVECAADSGVVILQSL